MKTAEPLILSIETATRAGGVAVSRGKKLLSAREGDAGISHSNNLIEMVQLALQEAGASLAEVELFAAAVGPGSFTGLRIGLATVKAFAAVTGKEIIGVSTLAAVAHAGGQSEETVALLPAGRGEVFAQMFRVHSDDVVPLDEAAHLTPKEALEKYRERKNLRWTGKGIQKIVEYSSDFAATSLSDSPATDEKPAFLVTSIAALALTDYREGKTVTPDELQAVYVRPSDAEINQRWQQQNLQRPGRN